MTREEFIRGPQFQASQPDKEPLLAAHLAALTRHHQQACPEYAHFVEVFHGPNPPLDHTEDIPFLPVSLFKSNELLSVPRDQVFKTLFSSGTTGQSVSKVYLDRPTAQLQTAGLAAVMTRFLGPERLPMLLIETDTLIKNPAAFSARGAGVLGMANFGRKHLYVLDSDMKLKLDALRAWLAEHGSQPFLMFGFTFMVWQYFYQEIRDWGLDLSRGILVHSGGWKKLIDQAITNDTFKARLKAATGLSRVHNFYGMVEQVGGVFVEGEDGLLRTPSFCEVIIRNPVDWKPLPLGETGVIQVLSAIPTSYPGHSILTEDLGTVVAIDQDGYGGKAFRVEGRIPRAELRGCSDTHAGGAGR